MTSKRISMSLFDDELKGLINASAKIFPISQIDIDTNLNPNNYEYGRVDRAIYIWQIDKWEYVIADDKDIDWEDVNNKPLSYMPSVHTHTGLHEHGNKSIIDSITSLLITSWNNAATHVSDLIKHITSDERTLWNTVSGKAPTSHTHVEANITNLDKYTKVEVNNLLTAKAPSSHDHDGRYFTESEVNALLGGKSALLHNHTEANISDLDKYTKVEADALLATKSPTIHGHTDLHTHTNKIILDKVIETIPQTSYDLSELKYIADIRAGYTEGHSHSNLTILGTITQLLIDGWNDAVTHISDALKHITSVERTLWNTVSNKEPSFAKNTAFNKNYGTTVGTTAQGNDSRFTDARTPLAHNHDTMYFTEAEVTAFLLGKSNTTHSHNDLYFTEAEVTALLVGKAEASTLSGHISNTTIHVTQTDKDNWNAGGNFATIGTTKPTDGSMWYQEI